MVEISQYLILPVLFIKSKNKSYALLRIAAAEIWYQQWHIVHLCDC